MIAAALLLTAAAPATAASTEALDLARVVAANGTAATVAPIIARKETADLIAAHPELTAAEQDRLRATARTVFADSLRRQVETEAEAFAAELSIEDLRVLAAHVQTQANRDLRAKMPAILHRTASTAGALNFGRDLARAFCADTGKLCQQP